MVIPGPNVPGFYFTFQVVGHFLSMRGAKHGLAVAPWTFKPSEDLSELRAGDDAGAAAAAAALPRARRPAAPRASARRFSRTSPRRPRDILDAVKLGDLAAQLGCQLEGDGDIEVARVATIEHAGPGDLTFLANSKYAVATCDDARVRDHRRGQTSHGAPCAVLRTSNPYLAFARATRLLNPAAASGARRSSHAVVAPDAMLEDGVSIGPYRRHRSRRADRRAHDRFSAHVGDRRRRRRSAPTASLHARVSIRERVVDRRALRHSGRRRGRQRRLRLRASRRRDAREDSRRSPTVVIEDDVEIGANTTIDRPAVGETRVKARHEDRQPRADRARRRRRHATRCSPRRWASPAAP